MNPSNSRRNPAPIQHSRTPIDAAQRAGIEPFSELPTPAPGAVARFRMADERTGKQSGWIKVDVDGRGGLVGDHRRPGEAQSWLARDNAPRSTAQRRSDRLEREQARAAERLVQSQAWEAAASKLRRDLEQPELVHGDPSATAYAQHKQITAFGAYRDGADLLVPMFWKGQVVNCQRIRPDGSKRFTKGCRVTGAHLQLGMPTEHQRILVAEGYATGCRLHMARWDCTFIAFTAGNLKAVALEARGLWPEIAIVLVADNDHATEQRIGRNPGVCAAVEAARAVDGKVIVPSMDKMNGRAAA